MDYNALEAVKHFDENTLASKLPAKIDLDIEAQKAIDSRAVELVRHARAATPRKGLMETFLEEFGLSNNEGLWTSHMGQSDSWLVNASTLGLMLTGRVVKMDPQIEKDPSSFMKKLTRKSGAPVIRAAIQRASQSSAHSTC